jgi:tRNA threonylcarbamoyladenosine biosynthesis protein TsaB
MPGVSPWKEGKPLLILAFETSAKAAGVALHDGTKLLAESYQNTGLTHSQTLMVMAEDLLKQCGLTVSNVTHVAVAAGPGSFTGVRIGVAAAKGFAWGGELPCYGVSTLEAMAKNLGVYDGIVCACMDARRNQVYNALFSAQQGVLQRMTEDRAIALADLKEELKALDKPIYLVGDGSHLTYATLSPEVPNLVLPPEHRMHQRGAGVALAALDKIHAGEIGDAAALEPNYLRLSQAERERLEKENNK